MATVAAVLVRAEAKLAAAGLLAPRIEAAAALRGFGLDPWLGAERPVADRTAARLDQAVSRRCHGEPLPYVLGRREFYGLDLVMAPGVFIPRPETEGVVSAAVARLSIGDRACDLCTGTGAVALAVAKARQATVDAVDLDPRAVVAATVNAVRLGLRERVRVRRGDLWKGLPAHRLGGYALCTCNPPYVSPEAWANLPPEVRRWEPAAALVPPHGDVVGMYARIAQGARRILRGGGWLVCEVGAGQSESVAGLFAREGLRSVSVERDLAGIGRVVAGRLP